MEVSEMFPKGRIVSTIILFTLLASACAPTLDTIEPASESFPTEEVVENNDVINEENPSADTELLPTEPTSESSPTEMVTDSVDDLQEEAPPTETETPPKEILLHPPATRTGLESLDKVLEAILSNRVEDRRAFVTYTVVGCTTADGLGGPPKCQAGEAEGTLLEVLPILGSEGHHARRESIDQALSFHVKGLYAIHLIPEDVWQDESFPAGEYGVVVVLADNPFPMTVHVKEGGIIRLDYHLGKTPIEVIEEREGELILPPPTIE